MTNTTKSPAKNPKTTAKSMSKAAITEALKYRDRHPFQGRKCPDEAPDVQPIGDGAVRVQAFGRHATGDQASFVMDEADWNHARQKWGDQWVVVPGGHATFVLGSGRRQVAAHAKQPASKAPTAILARLLTGALKGDVVTYMDGQFTNLRRSNLLVLTAAEASRRRALLRAAHFQQVAMARFPEVFSKIAGMASTPAAAF